MDTQRVLQLLQLYGSSSLTIGEQRELLRLLTSHEGEIQDAVEAAMAAYPAEEMSIGFEELLPSIEAILDVDREYRQEQQVGKGEKQGTGGKDGTGRIRRMLRRSVAAAAVLVLLVAGYWVRLRPNAAQEKGESVAAHHPVFPGRSGAILTLGDGTEIVVDSAGKGVVARQNGAVVMLRNGQLVYTSGTGANGTDVNGAGADGAVLYNTMSTPRGRQFQLALPDGTKVWLNAGSSITYPTRFEGGLRQVSIKGEAYFEVAADAQKPFKVGLANAAAIEVLGTRFNINAYEDEKGQRTTLAEGRVRVLDGAGGKVLLNPGQQALAGVGPLKVDEHADLGKALAWKNGLFSFEGASLGEVMRQIQRWYDIKVEYEKGIPDMHFFGEMPRRTPLSVLLNGLKRADVHFYFRGETLVVTR